MPADKEDSMVYGSDALECGIQKRLLHAGRQLVDYVYGTKVYFHYKTRIAGTETVLDDSKSLGENKPMEMVIGRQFKLAVWERALKTMWLHEVASFTVVKELALEYPMTAKQLRDYYAKQCKSGDCKHNHSKAKADAAEQHHCCGFNLIERGVGHADLDALLKEPQSLEFIFEVVAVEKPGEYEKDSFLLSEQERIDLIPKLKEAGNELFKSGQYAEAGAKYEEALAYLEQLMLKEKPNDVEWNELNALKMPILLNFSLCKFHTKDYYSCIEHTSTVLATQPSNVKALFRRAKAQAVVWNLQEARADFGRCVELDAGMEREVGAQLEHLNKLEAQKLKEEREMFQGKLFK